jgi:hypothetical protein
MRKAPRGAGLGEMGWSVTPGPQLVVGKQSYDIVMLTLTRVRSRSRDPPGGGGRADLGRMHWGEEMPLVLDRVLP